MLPLSSFHLKNRELSCFNFPIVAGIVPQRKLLPRESSSSLVRFPMKDGIGPESLLADILTKLNLSSILRRLALAHTGCFLTNAIR